MSEPLEKLEKAFQQQNVESDSSAKSATINAALQAFDQEYLSPSQEKQPETRLIQERGAFSPFLKWRQMMKKMNSRWVYALAGSASVSALLLAIIIPNTTYFSDDTLHYALGVNVPDHPETEPDELKDAIIMNGARIRHQDRQDKKVLVESVRSVRAEDLSAAFELQQSGFAPLPIHEGLDNLPPSEFEAHGRDQFTNFDTNPVQLVSESPVSTFSVDVDTASYSVIRASLNRNQLPKKDAVRVEEMINYFDYKYDTPSDAAQPFNATIAITPTPWNTDTKLLSIGIKGYEFQAEQTPDSNLVFLIDTSGSMNATNKLPLLVNSFKLLLSTLKPTDTISIVTYAGQAGTLLEPTRISDKSKILGALDKLQAGGSTAGAEGIRQAYTLAEANFKDTGINRVILATDGDFNVGISDPEQLKDFVERKRNTGITLSVLGFGQGNYNDALMQTLAQNGNGNANYIDTLSEARKVLVEEAGSTLFTIASDVKLQLEFNPDLVSEYRLIGYETRALNRDDFNNDKVDAGDIGAGHTVTALYEITPKRSEARLIDNLRYQHNQQSTSRPENATEYGFLKIRYKLPEQEQSKLITRPITVRDETQTLSGAADDVKFAASVAAFGQILRGGQYTGAFSYDDVINLARAGKGEDEFGYRAEFITLVRLAKSAAALPPLPQ